MNSRFNYVRPKKRDSSNDDEYSTFTYEERMRVISSNKDGSVDKYVKENVWIEKKNSWSEFINSFDIGSTSKQVKDHLKKGTPLLTAHTLPSADYRSIGKGAEIKRELEEKGISLDMLTAAVLDQMNSQNNEPEKVVKEGE